MTTQLSLLVSLQCLQYSRHQSVSIYLLVYLSVFLSIPINLYIHMSVSFYILHYLCLSVFKKNLNLSVYLPVYKLDREEYLTRNLP